MLELLIRFLTVAAFTTCRGGADRWRRSFCSVLCTRETGLKNSLKSGRKNCSSFVLTDREHKLKEAVRDIRGFSYIPLCAVLIDAQLL